MSTLFNPTPAIALFRKLATHDKFLCAVFPYSTDAHSQDKAHALANLWKADFISEFPEFRKALWFTIETSALT
jgi:hypothetical protein